MIPQYHPVSQKNGLLNKEKSLAGNSKKRGRKNGGKKAEYKGERQVKPHKNTQERFKML